MPDPGFTRPDLFSIPAGEQAEFAGAARGLLSADSYPPAGDDPPAPLARDGARTPVEAGFTLRHCDRYDPLWRDLLPCGEHRAGDDDRMTPYARPVEHGRAHADEDQILDGAPVERRVVADGDV